MNCWYRLVNDVKADGDFFGTGFYGNKTSLNYVRWKITCDSSQKKRVTFLIGSTPDESMGRGPDGRDSRGLDRADDGFKCWKMQKK